MKKEWKILSKLSLNGSKEGKVSRVEDKDSISKGLAKSESERGEHFSQMSPAILKAISAGLFVANDLSSLTLVMTLPLMNGQSECVWHLSRGQWTECHNSAISYRLNPCSLQSMSPILAYCFFPITQLLRQGKNTVVKHIGFRVRQSGFKFQFHPSSLVDFGLFILLTNMCWICCAKHWEIRR